MNMTRIGLRALKKSIKHWERICCGDDTQIDADHCALCQVFHSQFRTDGKDCCAGCPVAVKAKETNCVNTPFQQVVRILGQLEFHAGERYRATSNITAWTQRENQLQGELILAQRLELNFLRSLLPVTER